MSIERCVIAVLGFVIIALLMGDARIEFAGAVAIIALLFGLVIGCTLQLDKPSKNLS